MKKHLYCCALLALLTIQSTFKQKPEIQAVELLTITTWAFCFCSSKPTRNPFRVKEPND